MMTTCALALGFSALALSVEASSEPLCSGRLQPCRRRHPVRQWSTENQCEIRYKSSTDFSSRGVTLETRGGGIWGRKEQGEEIHRPPEESDADAEAAVEAPDEEYEYEYEYEYYETNGDAEGYEYAEYENSDVEDEYNEEDDENKRNLGKAQDISGEFYSSDEEVGAVEVEESVDSGEIGENDAGVEVEEKDAQGHGGRFFWGRSKSDSGAGPKDDRDSKLTDDDKRAFQKIQFGSSEEAEEMGTYAEEEEEDYLFTTPLPLVRENDVQSPGKLQLANRTVPKADIDVVDDKVEYEENENLEEEMEPDDDSESYLLETPIVKSRPKSTSPKRKAPNESKAKTSGWWQYRRPQISENRQSKRKQWRPTSSSKASFISPLRSGTSPSFFLRSTDRRSICSEWGSSISAAVAVIIHPIGNTIRTITYSLTCYVSKLMTASFSFVRNTFDFLWYGPVDGVTTTGIASRDGGLSSLLASPYILTAVSFIVVLGLAGALIRKWHENAILDNGRGNFRRLDSYDDEEDTDEDTANPPSIEEELEFLNREFDPANPSSKDRITQAIAKQKKFAWPPLRRDDRQKSRRGQRQFTIKSIQKWWKERPSQQSVAIIEPQHLHNQQQPPNQEVKRLQKQLSVSEQERALLQQDVQRLQHRLQRAQHDARSVVSQNRWLEKQTSKADRILTRAVDAERRKANEEMGRVRESMRGVLERERMLMRGRMAGGSERRDAVGQNDVDLNKGTPKRILDGVKIVREVDQMDETNVESDGTWTAM
eukprot:CAMPEP_0172538604 /NCGR_PEP_ID=MMETSP1067-20121228/9966_1 /TAXON_ID=265564 ORGANISM="Thalassiosira punctigera, Strain Tpunct2005C2" /NCGR_SAMPLE_ID=MMETSP1067 /ASSEMBLY_ACC=CAM_ASM_000444 /LENGTH=765 /DNA_ID=CAMNT_0013324131 /DNA_START=74 /DNA_END=2371 /DNA_ORIENTATION=+